jgi:hypothetical protein
MIRKYLCDNTKLMKNIKGVPPQRSFKVKKNLVVRKDNIFWIGAYRRVRYLLSKMTSLTGIRSLS